MYILIDAYRDVKPGDVVVIKSDRAGGIGAFLIGGEKIGELSTPKAVFSRRLRQCAAWKSKVTAWLSPNNQKICLNRAYSF